MICKESYLSLQKKDASNQNAQWNKDPNGKLVNQHDKSSIRAGFPGQPWVQIPLLDGPGSSCCLRDWKAGDAVPPATADACRAQHSPWEECQGIYLLSTNLECCCSSWADLVGKSWNSLVFESLIFLLLSFLFYIWCIDLSKPGESSPSFVSESQPYLPSPLSSLQSSRELQGRLTPALVTPSPSPSCSQSDSPSLSRCRMETDATGREDLWPVTTVWLLF